MEECQIQVGGGGVPAAHFDLPELAYQPRLLDSPALLRVLSVRRQGGEEVLRVEGILHRDGLAIPDRAVLLEVRLGGVGGKGEGGGDVRGASAGLQERRSVRVPECSSAVVK